MQYLKAKLVKELVDFLCNDHRRIEHALDVLHHAEIIMQDREDYDNDIVIASALLHDVGIKPSEAELGYNNGKTQEKYGPPIAGVILTKIGFPSEKIEKVKEIIGNHHSPSKYDYIELEILKEADKLVNILENAQERK